MAMGFLKSVKQQVTRSGPAKGVTSAREPSGSRPGRIDVLNDVEQLGIGMFWATDAEGRLSFLSQHALDDLGLEGEAVIGKPLA
jgi:hypothetical protein